MFEHLQKSDWRRLNRVKNGIETLTSTYVFCIASTKSAIIPRTKNLKPNWILNLNILMVSA
jgi:hypothetical protein